MAQIGIWNSKGGVVLNKYLVARIFAFDDHESEARAGPSARRKRASAKFSPRATSRAAVVTPEDKENAPAPFSAEVAAAPFSAELTAGAFDDYGDCKQS